jgi:hypothetical protein
MLDPVIIVNAIAFGFAFYMSTKRLRKDNPHLWLHILCAFVSGYIFLVYLSSIIGLVPEQEIRFYMRWFLSSIAILIYMIAKYG